MSSAAPPRPFGTPRAATLWLWWASGAFVLLVCIGLSLPPGHGRGPGAWLKAAGRFGGYAGLWLWTLSLLLMLRPMRLERALGGLDRLYLLHHRVGALAYLLLLSHPVLLAAGTAWRDRLGGAQVLLPAEPTWPLIAGWLALLGLMAMLAATFWLPMRYGRWKQVHALSAPAFVFGGLHALALMPRRFDAGWALAAFGVLLGAGALLLRRAMEAGRLRAHEYRVTLAAPVGCDAVAFDLAPVGAGLHWQAGQFVFAAFADDGARRFGRFHPFTVASADRHGGRMRLVIKALGAGTRSIVHLPAGTAVRLQGPYGGFLAACEMHRPQLWLGAGIGITPFLAAADGLPAQHAPVDLFVFAATEPEAVQLWPGVAGVQSHHATGRHPPEALADRIAREVADLPDRQVFMCGPPPLMAALAACLRARGVAAADIHCEVFDFR